MSHSKLSPSSSKRWMICAGSIRLIEELGVESKTSKYAAEGTVAHSVGEDCLENNEDAVYYIGEYREADGYKLSLIHISEPTRPY